MEDPILQPANVTRTLAKDDRSFSVKPTESFPCPHAQIIKHKSRANCFTCGVALHENSITAYKSQKMNFGTYFNPSRIYTSSTKQRLPKVVYSADSEYFKQRNNLLEIVGETSDKLNLSANSTHLAILYMDVALSRIGNIPTNLLPVYAATSVMIAAKSIELDERIPFISKLQRYSGLMMFNPREFAAAEQVILRELKWNLQCTTAIDVLDYYFSQGVLFSNDMLTDDAAAAAGNGSSTDDSNALREKSTTSSANTTNDAQSNFSKISMPAILTKGGLDESKEFTMTNESQSKEEKENKETFNKKKLFVSDLSNAKVLQLVLKMEKEYMKLTKLLAKDTRFFDYDVKTLGAACVSFLRKMNGIATLWNSQLSAISNNEVFESQLSDCLSQLESCYRSSFVPLQPSSQVSHQQNSAQKRAVKGSNNANSVLKDAENIAPVIALANGQITPAKIVMKPSYGGHHFSSNNQSAHNNSESQQNNSIYKLLSCKTKLQQFHSEIQTYTVTTAFGESNSNNSSSTAASTTSQPVKSSAQNAYSHYQPGTNNNINYSSSSHNHNSTAHGYLRSQSFQQANNYLRLTRFGSNVI